MTKDSSDVEVTYLVLESGFTGGTAGPDISTGHADLWIKMSSMNRKTTLLITLSRHNQLEADASRKNKRDNLDLLEHSVCKAGSSCRW